MKMDGELLMSNLELLQKLTLGIKDTETVKIELEDDTTHDFTIRPLTSGELTKLQSLEQKPYNMKIKLNAQGKKKSVEKVPDTGLDVSMGDFTEYQAKAMYTAIAWSLSVDDEKVKPEDVESLPNGIPELLFTEVIRISKLTEADLTSIKSFRNK